MEFDFSQVEKPLSTLCTALRTVYVVYADKTYDVRKNGKTPDETIALRTLRGEGRVEIEGCKPIEVRPETLLLFAHREVRRYVCTGDTWDFWWFEFKPEGALPFDVNKPHHVGYSESEAADLKDCLDLLRHDDDKSSFLASSTLTRLIYRWGYESQSTLEEYSPHKALAARIVHRMKVMLPEMLSVTEMASMAGFCERRFRQVFVEVTGLPPKKFYDRMRLTMAEELLRSTPLTLAEIADRLGYSSQFHLAKAFRGRYGYAPSAVRSGRQTGRLTPKE